MEKNTHHAGPKPPLSKFLIPALSVIITLLVLQPVLKQGFLNWDDDLYVTDNKNVKVDSFSDIFKVFDPDNMSLDTYTPLTLFSFAIDYRIAGDTPFWYHLVNLLLHLLNTGLVYALIFLLVPDWRVAGFVSLLFGIHPVHVESVAWISERKDVLFAFWFLLSAILYALYLKGFKGNWHWQKAFANPYLWFSVLCFLLSCLSKPQAITLPIVLLLIDFWKKRPWQLGWALDKLPFLIIAITTVAAALVFKLAEPDTIAFSERFWLSTYALGHYLENFFLPFELNAVPPFPEQLGIYHYISLAIMTILGMVSLWGIKRNPVLAFGLFWYAVNIGHTLHFFKVNSAPYYDRFTYLPYIGLLFILAMGIKKILDIEDGLVKKAVPWLAGTIILFCCWQSYNRTKVWKDNYSFWTDVIQKAPDHYIGHCKRGLYWSLKGDFTLALSDLDECLRLNPSFPYGWTNRGMIFLQQGKHEKAIHNFSQSIQLDPVNAKAFMNRGVCYLNTNQLAVALKDLNQSIKLGPQFALAYINRGFVYQRLRKTEKAFKDFDLALQIEPTNGIAFLNRGIEHYRQKRYNAALQDMTTALPLSDNKGMVHLWRSRVYQALNNLPASITDETHAQHLLPQLPPSYYADTLKLDL